MDFTEGLTEREKEIIRLRRHDMALGQKLTLADIRQISPDIIKIYHIEGDLRPERHFSLIVTKGDKVTHYGDEEVDLSVAEMTALKEEFEVQEMTLEGTPGPAAIKLAEREWDEWVKVHGGKSPFRRKS
jgi:hypothetical protein